MVIYNITNKDIVIAIERKWRMVEMVACLTSVQMILLTVLMETMEAIQTAAVSSWI